MNKERWAMRTHPQGTEPLTHEFISEKSAQFRKRVARACTSTHLEHARATRKEVPCVIVPLGWEGAGRVARRGSDASKRDEPCRAVGCIAPSLHARGFSGCMLRSTVRHHRGVRSRVESEEVGTEQPFEQLAPHGQDAVDLRAREWRVQEPRDLRRTPQTMYENTVGIARHQEPSAVDRLGTPLSPPPPPLSFCLFLLPCHRHCRWLPHEKHPHTTQRWRRCGM